MINLGFNFDKVIGESYSGSMTVSKTVHGGSNPSSPGYLFKESDIHDNVFPTLFLLLYNKGKELRSVWIITKQSPFTLPD